jgi:hypothetical protein
VGFDFPSSKETFTFQPVPETKHSSSHEIWDCLNRQIPLFLLPCKGLVLVIMSTTSRIEQIHLQLKTIVSTAEGGGQKNFRSLVFIYVLARMVR